MHASVGRIKMKKIALTLLSAFTAATLSCGVAFATESPSSESPTAQSPSSQSPTAQSPSAQSPSAGSPSAGSPSDNPQASGNANATAESTAEAQGEEVPETSPQTGLDLDLVAGGSLALLAVAGAAGVALRKELN